MSRFAILAGFLLVLVASLFFSPAMRGGGPPSAATPPGAATPPSAATPRGGAQPGTATPPPPLLDARGFPLDFCTPEQIARATGIAERPATPWAAVNPLDSPDRYLSLAVVTVPPDACVGYHSHVGATILYVQAGTIEYAANGLLNPAGLEIRRGRDGSGTPPAEVPFWVPITLGAGEWVSQNTDAWHSFRNVGDEPAVIVVSAYFYCVRDCPTPPASIPACRGGCRGFGR